MGEIGRTTSGKIKELICLPLTIGGSTLSRKSNETLKIIVTTTFIGLIFGFLLGASISLLFISKINPLNYIHGSLVPKVDHVLRQNQTLNHTSKIWVNTNPRGAERLPPGIIVSESDLYLRRLWGEPSEDLIKKPKYLVTFTVGYDQKENINASIQKFSNNFTIMLFHYDGRTSEWEEFEWSKRAIHVSARKQTKWWFAKRFLHPDIVAEYDYIFIWDEDLGVDNFDGEKYIDMVKKHGLEISQPGVDPTNGVTWAMTKRSTFHEVHKEADDLPEWCKNPLRPPCAGFVEIMAPVFSRKAWRCIWHMIQPAHEKIGVVDTQWIVHKRIPSLGNQGNNLSAGIAPWVGVKLRCKQEWKMFADRLNKSEVEYEKLLLEARHR
ncbi:hypothetical protein RND81_02G233400 [Saponaria officinalis]|uniref:Storage protein n=1 Tax=Saponaria officinalis TaxID=3572 RepID=A0AAW1MP69_SAPOF